MFELFVVGTFWFWALIIAEIILLFVFIENENGFGATAAVLIGAAVLQWCGNVDFIGYIASHPWHILAGTAAYFVLGACWGTAKWWIYCRDRLEDYNEWKREWLRGRDVTGLTVPDGLKEDFSKALTKENFSRYTGKLGVAPIASAEKARILRWMTFWWVSMIWSLINDFVRRMFRAIYYRIASALQTISDKMFASAKDDLPPLNTESPKG